MTSSRRFGHPFAVPPLLAMMLFAMPAAADDNMIATTIEPASSDAEVGATLPPEAPAPRYPRAVIARPLTLPAGLLAIGADAGANHDFSAMTGAPIAGYGITDKLEVQVPYAFATHDFEARGTIAADLGYVIVRGAVDGKLEAIARVRTGYDTLASDPLPLSLGVHVQYNITPTVALISGAPGTQPLRFALAKTAADTRPIDISLPFGIGVQPAPTFYLQLDTKLAQLSLHDSDTVLIGRDVAPFSLTAVWNAIPALDLQAAVGTDLMNAPGDALTFLIGARYYAGEL
ncbi:hypothetical protein BH11MYX3_BH11MYX3_35840 [soil metagenome]